MLSNNPGPMLRPVHLDGGANDRTGESVRFGESRVHGVGLGLEQKETKEAKENTDVIYDQAPRARGEIARSYFRASSYAVAVRAHLSNGFVSLGVIAD